MKSNRIIIIIIIIKIIIFVIHMYLWGIGTVFLSRYPRICNLTNVELGGGNGVLAEAPCSTSSSRWSYFQFTCICVILTLYFSANVFVFQNGISLETEVKFDFWKRQMLKIITPMIMFLIHMYLWGTGAVFLWRYPHISSRTIFKLGGWNQVLAPFWRALF